MRSSIRVQALLLILVLSAPSIARAVVCNPKSGIHPPLAVDDVAYVNSGGTAVAIAVLSNDVVSSTGSLEIVNVSIPTRGKAVENADNTITYTPNSVGEDSFTYTIVDTSQENAPSSQATVTVIPQAGFPINVECHGGDCLFDAAPPSFAGIRRFVWNFGDGSSEKSGWKRTFHQYSSEGAFTVRARAERYSGAVDEGVAVVNIVLQRSLVWNLTTDGLGVRVLVDYQSLLGFPGGAVSAKLHVSFGDQPTDCTYLCGGGTAFSCFPYCQSIGDAYYRTGTYPVRMRITDENDTTYEYAKYAEAVNSPPRPAFTYERDGVGTFSYAFDPGTSWDDFDIHSAPPYAPTPYEWDFGDGMTAVVDRPDKVTHVYPGPGQYTVGLRLTDAGGEVGFATMTVDVVNAPPVPHIAVNCKLLECTFSSTGTTDDQDDISAYHWTFGDGTTAAGSTVTKTYAAANCYTVNLEATDGDGASATASQIVPVGPPVFAKAGQVTVDAHVQSFTYNGWPETSSGNLNGILEPGETAIVEPQWTTTPSVQPVSVSASSWTTTDSVYASPSFRDFASEYDISTGKSDCWSAGRCYAVRLQGSATGRGPNVHNDITFHEAYAANGQPTPGSPVLIHVGASFTDVPVAHWAYPFIESVLHAGIASATSGYKFSPNAAVTRAEVAEWLVRAKHGASFEPPACTTAPFPDVPCTHPYAKWIAQLRTDGIVSATPSGGGDGDYLPDLVVTRAEMAVLVLRAKLGSSYEPPACTWEFGDAPCPQYWASAWISEVKRRGISNGCAANEFCPEGAVDRAQAASFIARTFDLTLGAKACDANGFDTIQGHQPPPAIASLAFHPSPAVAGQTSTGTITLGLATQHGVTVPLSIDVPTAATVPASVFVPPGAFSATFTVTAANVPVRTVTNVTATYLGQQMTTELVICTPAPTITAQPQPVTIYRGQSTTLSVTASGGGALTYQWFEGVAPSTAKPIGGNTNTLTVSPTALAHYWVRVSNECAATDSVTATVKVCVYPVVTHGPLNDVVVSGNATTLDVTVDGSEPLSYQWYEGASGDTSKPVGTNASTFTTPAISESRSYWVRVTSTCKDQAIVNSPVATITPVTQITRRQLAATTANLQTGITANWTRPTQPGSLIVAVMSASRAGGSVGAFTFTAGWQKAVSYEFTDVATAIYYYPNHAGGRTSETVANTGYRNSVLQLIEYVGARPAPLDVVAFDGAHTPRTGSQVSTGTPPSTTTSRSAIVSAFSTNAQASFTSPSNGFVTIDDRPAFQDLTAVLNERLTTDAGVYGHTAIVDATGPWVGMLAAFRSIVDCTAAPTITAQPQSTTINGGASATLSVTATGGGLRYQWFQGPSGTTTTPIAGATGPTFTVTPGATRSYWVRVTNACGEVASAGATVNVCWPAAITTHPLSQTVTSGFAATLSVVASGNGLTYQWYTGPSGTATNPIAGATSATYTTPALTVNKRFWVRVTGTCNGTTVADSTTTYLTVVTPTEVGRRQSASNIANSQKSITTDWPQPTQAGSLLVAVFSAEHVASVGEFTVPAGWQLANSSSQTNLKTSIYYYPNHPGGRTSETFGTAGFSDQILQLIEYTGATATPLDRVAVAGNAAVSGGAVSTGTTPATTAPKEVIVTALTALAKTTFTGASASFTKLDERSVFEITTAVHERIVSATGAYGHTANTAANTQWVGLVTTFKSLDGCTDAPTISGQPLSSTINAGGTATLSVTATGGGLTYQWYKGSSGVTTTPVGTNSNTFTTPVLSATSSYWVRVSNACGTTSSSTATVKVCTPPAISSHPASQTINSGTTSTLSVVAGGSGPFTYQWYEGASGTTTHPVGTNSASLTTPPLTATKSYWVRVTSTCLGSKIVNSTAATITVTSPVTLGRRQLAGNSVGAQKTITTNWTQPTQAGSLLVAVVSARRQIYPIANFAPPPGWQLAVSYEWLYIKTAIYYYPNHPGGRTAEAFATGDIFCDLTLQIAEYTGVDTASPLDRTTFTGDNSNSGTVATKNTTTTSHAREVVITALTSYSATSFDSPSGGFVELDERVVGYRLTTALHEKLVTTTGSWGHSAQVGDPAQWIGLVATFKAAQ